MGSNKTNVVLNINYDTGWVIAMNAIKGSGNEYNPRTVYDNIRRTLQKEGRWFPNEGMSLRDQTKEMEDWERRRTRKPFDRPKGMFIFQILDPTGEHGVGRGTLNEWPTVESEISMQIRSDALDQERCRNGHLWAEHARFEYRSNRPTPARVCTECRRIQRFKKRARIAISQVK